MKNFYKKTSCYTTLPNAFAQDYRLSIEAKGLGLLIFSLPDDWIFRQEWFYYKAGGENINRRKTVVKSLNELIRFDYLFRIQDRKMGKFDEAIWFFDPEGHAQSELKAILSVSTHGSNGTAGTNSAGPESACTHSTPIKEERTKEEIQKEDNTPKPQKGGSKVGSKLKIPTLSQIADQHRITISTIEDYIEYRLNSGGIDNPIAFEKHMRRELSEPYSDESVKLEEWFEALSNKDVIDHLINQFLSTQRTDRRFCRELAKDDFALKAHNIVPSDAAIEISYQRAEVKRRERVGGVV